MAVVSTERQFDSHYLEEHLDLDLKEQQRMSTNNKTNGYARIPTHEAAAEQCRCQKISSEKKLRHLSTLGAVTERRSC